MSITLTEKAATEIKRAMTDSDLDGQFLRVAVTGGGCSGFSYSLGFDSNYDAKMDAKSDQHGVDVVIDRKSALYLEGATIDYHEDINRRGFTFENPNATKTCGCGSSFQA